MIDYLYKKVTRPNIVGPAFVYNYPKAMQPLARPSDANPNIVEQWQLVVNGWEVIKAYSELVDPVLQKQILLINNKHWRKVMKKLPRVMMISSLLWNMVCLHNLDEVWVLIAS